MAAHTSASASSLALKSRFYIRAQASHTFLRVAGLYNPQTTQTCAHTRHTHTQVTHTHTHNSHTHNSHTHNSHTQLTHTQLTHTCLKRKSGVPERCQGISESNNGELPRVSSILPPLCCFVRATSVFCTQSRCSFARGLGLTGLVAADQHLHPRPGLSLCKSARARVLVCVCVRECVRAQLACVFRCHQQSLALDCVIVSCFRLILG